MVRHSVSRIPASRFVAFLLALAVSTALAETKVVDELISSMQFGSQLESGRNLCREKARNLDVNAIQTRNPALFLGIGPLSQEWPEVKRAYVHYAEQVCVPVSINMYSKIAEDVYLERLSSAELQQAVDFLKSPAGRKFVDASAEVTSHVNEAMVNEAENAQRSAWKMYEAKILEIRRRHLMESESSSDHP